MLLGLSACQVSQRIPDPDWVVDESDVLSADEESQLIDLLLTLNETTGVELACVVVDKTGDGSTAAFARTLLTSWEVGRAGVYNGIIIVVDMEARHVHLERGEGMRWTLNENDADTVVTAITSHLTEGRYFEGIRAGIEAVSSHVAGVSWDVEYYTLSAIPAWGAEGAVVSFSGTVRGVNGDTVFVLAEDSLQAKVVLLPGTSPEVMEELWHIHGRIQRRDPLEVLLLGLEAEDLAGEAEGR